MVNLKIDHNEISVPEGTTIMEAAALAGIDIPKLCYLKDINEIAACRVCLVEVTGKEKLVTACNNKVQEGLEILTNSPKVRIARKQNVQLILSQHDFKCATCVRSGNCTLQTLSNDLNIIDLPFKERVEHAPWDKNFPLIRDTEKCIKCMRCIQVCDKVQGLGIWDVTAPVPGPPSMSKATAKSPMRTVFSAASASPTARSAPCASAMIRKRYGMPLLIRRKL